MIQQSWENATIQAKLPSGKLYTLNWQKWIGAGACVVLISACFLHWAYYPDVQKYFTGFDTKVFFRGKMQNYYGRPGILLSFFAMLCFAFHLLPKLWAKRANLLLTALCAAYAIKSYFMISAAYTGFVPVVQAGLWIMLGAAIVNLLMAMMAKSQK